jgi:hypothetical protein
VRIAADPHRPDQPARAGVEDRDGTGRRAGHGDVVVVWACDQVVRTSGNAYAVHDVPGRAVHDRDPVRLLEGNEDGEATRRRAASDLERAVRCLGLEPRQSRSR